jgi:hypothetical protein
VSLCKTLQYGGKYKHSATHSQSQYRMEVSGQLHTPTALSLTRHSVTQRTVRRLGLRFSLDTPWEQKNLVPLRNRKQFIDCPASSLVMLILILSPNINVGFPQMVSPRNILDCNLYICHISHAYSTTCSLPSHAP